MNKKGPRIGGLFRFDRFVFGWRKGFSRFDLAQMHLSAKALMIFQKIGLTPWAMIIFSREINQIRCCHVTDRYCDIIRILDRLADHTGVSAVLFLSGPRGGACQRCVLGRSRSSPR